MTRFDKPAEGAMIVVQQRLHQDDLIGRLRDEGGWDYLEMPGECVERQVFDLGDGETWVFNPGDLLFEERFNRAALEQLFWDLGEGPYNAQILQRPSPPGGLLFKLKHFQRYEKPPKSRRIDRAELGPGDGRHRDRRLFRLHHLGHSWSEALPARRPAQAAGFP